MWEPASAKMAKRQKEKMCGAIFAGREKMVKVGKGFNFVWSW